MKILLADDDPTTLTTLKRVLAKWEHEVTLAEDGGDALEKLRDGTQELAILDWMMPTMNGPDICRELRALRPAVHTYLILLTSKNESASLVEGLEAGADDYIIKPFNHGELRARINVGARVVRLQRNLTHRVSELQKALEHIRTLEGLIRICMHCHRILTDDQSWQRLEAYIEAHTAARLSHGLCPECLELHYPEPK